MRRSSNWKHQTINKVIKDLKEWIAEEWEALPQDAISRAINSFKEGVRMIIKKNVGHIEKYI